MSSSSMRGEVLPIKTQFYTALLGRCGLHRINYSGFDFQPVLSTPIRPAVSLKSPFAMLQEMDDVTRDDNVHTCRFGYRDIFGEFTVEALDHYLVLGYTAEAIRDKTDFCPARFSMLSNRGSLLVPGSDLPLNLADPKLASRSWKIDSGQSIRWGHNSQLGFLVEELNEKTDRELVVQRVSENEWSVGIWFHNLYDGEQIAGSHKLYMAPFNGASNIDYAFDEFAKRKHMFSVPAAGPAAVSVPFSKPSMDRLTATLDNIPVTLSAEINRAGMRGHHWSFDAEATRLEIEGENLWQIECTINNKHGSEALFARVDAYAETSCANPSWDGDATVLVPGNFARTNYNPAYLHGGGPKYGPTEVPEKEELTANDDAPGRCNGWIFAASRLPQVWTAAIDRTKKEMVWLGTEPLCDFGETSAGFLSPAGKPTIVRLSTPTTYEPWVPLGYSRMRAEARRDHTSIPAGGEFTWRFYIAIRKISDLNAWAPLERALYLRNRPKQPTPIKMSLDDAAQICASALFERFYQEKRGVLVYSTGPNGQAANLGFTGMAHSALVLMWAGEEFGKIEWSRAGVHVMNTVVEMFHAGPKFPWTAVPANKTSGEVDSYVHGSGEPGYVVMVAFDNLAESIRREKSKGRDHQRWLDALRRCADAWLEHQSVDGAYPHWGPAFAPDFPEYDYATTNVEAGVIANMIDAYDLFADEKYLNSAKRAAVFYARQLDNGQLWGGPGDIRALVNSEVPMFFLRGFRRLYEATGDEEHKRLMLLSASWRYSFQFAHSWLCDADSPLFKQGWAGLGSENASACNLHSVAFGCINVPDMWALWKLTGDEYHRMRCDDLARYSKQQYARFAGDLGFPFAGAGTESWWTSDSVWGKGHPWIFTDPGFNLGYMSWVTGWSGYGALHARALSVGD